MDESRYVGGDHELVEGDDGWLHCVEEYRQDADPLDDGTLMYAWRCPHLYDVIRYERADRPGRPVYERGVNWPAGATASGYGVGGNPPPPRT